MTVIYHITTCDAWLVSRERGEYRAESLSSQGFIHFSQIHQVLDVAEKFYAAQRGLLLLAVDSSRLEAQLKYEPPLESGPAADQLFPHLYGPLNLDAVLAVHDFEPGPDGKFSL